MDLYFEVETQETPVKLGLFLRRSGVSMGLLRSAKYVEGGLLVDGQPAHTNRLLLGGEQVTLHLPERATSVEAEEIPLEILYESAHAMVINKPAGLVMHPTLSHHGGTMANGFAWLMRQRGAQLPFRPVGRLDAGTSGLVLCAMNAYAAPLLAREMEKVYYALAAGALPLGQGCIDAPLGAASGSAIQQQVCPGGRPSLTEYEVLAASSAASLVRVMPKTGRTHQIRTHFAHIAHPLLGDWLYGQAMDGLDRQALHCGELTFQEPGRGQVCLCAPLPADMLAAAGRVGLPVESGFALNLQK